MGSPQGSNSCITPQRGRKTQNLHKGFVPNRFTQAQPSKWTSGSRVLSSGTLLVCEQRHRRGKNTDVAPTERRDPRALLWDTPHGARSSHHRVCLHAFLTAPPDPETESGRRGGNDRGRGRARGKPRTGQHGAPGVAARSRPDHGNASVPTTASRGPSHEHTLPGGSSPGTSQSRMGTQRGPPAQPDAPPGTR